MAESTKPQNTPKDSTEDFKKVQRDCLSKWLRYCQNDDGSMGALPKGDHGKYFQNCIVEGNALQNFDPALLCSAHSEYNQIQFKSVDFNETLGDALKEILENVTTIGIWNCWSESGDYNSVLKHCKRMKNLIYFQDFDLGKNLMKYSTHMDKSLDWFRNTGRTTNYWMLSSYPMVEHIQCLYVRGGPAKNFAHFLQKNPTIKSLTWQFHKDCIDSTHELLKTVVECCTALEELFLSFVDYGNLAVISKALKQLCSGTNFKRLELKFATEYIDPERWLRTNFDVLLSLRNLTGLHLCGLYETSGARFPDLSSFTALKTLTIQGRFFQFYEEPHNNLNLSKRLTNLQELYLNNVTGHTGTLFFDEFDVTQYIMPFAMHSPKLIKIVVQDVEIEDRHKVIPLLGELRKKLNGATKLTIHFEENEFKKFVNAITLLHAHGNGLVEVKEVTIIKDVLNVANPFYAYSCEVKE